MPIPINPGDTFIVGESQPAWVQEAITARRIRIEPDGSLAIIRDTYEVHAPIGAHVARVEDDEGLGVLRPDDFARTYEVQTLWRRFVNVFNPKPVRLPAEIEAVEVEERDLLP